MKVINKNLKFLLIGALLTMHSAFASAAMITDYELKFSDLDRVDLGQQFDVDVYLDVPLGQDLTGFGFNFISTFSNVSFDGFTLLSEFLPDAFNDVAGSLFDPLSFGPTGDNALIGTLHFTALSVGNETVEAYGDALNFGGAFFSLDFGSVGGTFDISVVSEPSVIAVFLLGGLMLLRLNTTKRT